MGPLKLFPIAGREIPVQQYEGINTQVELTQQIDSSGEIYGVVARIVATDTVELLRYAGVLINPPPFRRLMGKQINRHPLTRGYLRWVEQKRLSFLTEASQFPGATL